jgi:predicted Zn-dependent peptidase
VIRSYYDRIYRPENLLIAAAGNLEHAQLIDLAGQYFGQLAPGQGDFHLTPPEAAYPIVLRNKPDLEQSHLVIGAQCPSAVSDDRYAVNLMNVILGGGMSSRLFQSVREDRGLVYTIFSSTSPYKDCGYLSIYAAASTGQLPETMEATMAELKKMKAGPVSAEELLRNKDQLKASLMLNLESTSSRMSSLATQEMIFGCFISPDQIISRVDAVTAEDVQRLAIELFQPEKMAVTVLGDLDGFTLDRSDLEC